MLNDFTGADKVYIACGYTDLRKGIDGLARLVQQQFELDPFTNTLFLSCGRRRDRIKGLYWEREGFIRCTSDWNRERINGALGIRSKGFNATAVPLATCGCTAPAAAQNRLLCCMSTNLREKRSTPSVSCKASQAGCTRMATRDTTDCRAAFVWWAVGRMQDENLTRH